MQEVLEAHVNGLLLRNTDKIDRGKKLFTEIRDLNDVLKFYVYSLADFQ